MQRTKNLGLPVDGPLDLFRQELASLLDQYGVVARMDASNRLITGLRAGGTKIPVDTHRRLKIVGDGNFPFGHISSVNGSDIGGTTRRVHTTVSPLSMLVAAVSTHTLADGGSEGATETDTGVTRNIDQFRVSFEFPLSGGHVTHASKNGDTTFKVAPTAPVVLTEPVGFPLPAGAQFAVRTYVKPALIPSGTPTAAAAAGGSLAAQAWYYVATRVELGVESGPTAEFSATTASANLSVAITIVDTRSASADCYRIYRSSASGGTKQFIGQTIGPMKSFVDTGYAADTTITPPVASSYKYNGIAANAGEGSNHVNSSGNGSDTTGTAGTAGMSTAGFWLGTTVSCLLGDDTSGKSYYFTGDSIGRGSGYATTTGLYLQNANFINLSFSPGQINCCNACYPGSTLSAMLHSALTPGGGRSRILLGQYADDWVDEHGTNDLAFGRTGVQLAQDKILLGQIANAFGVRFHTTTITPRGTTTNNGLTTAGFTPGSMNTERVWFNSWCRAGFLVNASGVPVLTGGTPTPYIQSLIDICSVLEVNASNVLTENGGYWEVPTTATLTGQVLTGTPTTTSLSVTGTPYVSKEHISRVIKMTSGALAGQTAVISDNTTSGFTVYAAGSGSQSGIPVQGFSAAPAAGDTFEVWEVICNEGLHPSKAGHVLYSTVLAPWIVANSALYA